MLYAIWRTSWQQSDGTEPKDRDQRPVRHESGTAHAALLDWCQWSELTLTTRGPMAGGPNGGSEGKAYSCHLPCPLAREPVSVQPGCEGRHAASPSTAPPSWLCRHVCRCSPASPR